MSVPSYGIDEHHTLLQHLGYQKFVQALVDRTLYSLRVIRDNQSMSGYDRTHQLAKAKLRVYLIFLKRDPMEMRATIDEFQDVASTLLTDVMEGEVGNIAILHADGGYSEETPKVDEQSRQLAICLKNSVDVMEFLYAQSL